MSYRVAYYAHHHGSGHALHAAAWAQIPGVELTVLTSRARLPVMPRAQVVSLIDDALPEYQEPGGSPFHYAPNNEPVIQKRSWQIINALHEFQPDCVVVDVSLEVSLLARLAGYPVIVRRQHGNRSDEAHQLMYRSAQALVAYYAQPLEQADFTYANKTIYAGMRLQTLPASQPKPKTIAVITSLGGSGIPGTDLDAAARATPDYTWHIAGKVDGKVAAQNCKVLGVVNPEVLIAQSSMVITSGGHNAVRIGLSSGKPYIIIPEDRPFNEQRMFAQHTAQVTGAVWLPSWQRIDWRATLDSLKAPHVTHLVSQEAYQQNILNLLASVTRKAN